MYKSLMAGTEHMRLTKRTHDSIFLKSNDIYSSLTEVSHLCLADVCEMHRCVINGTRMQAKWEKRDSL